jgi:hypothetical protein
VPVTDLEQYGLDALLLHGLTVLLAHLERARVQLDCGVDVLDRHSDVIDTTEKHGRGYYDA